MNIYYDVEDNHYRTYPDGDIATIDQMRELIEDENLSIVKLQQENKKLNGAIQTYDILLKANAEENKQLKDNWDKLKEWVNKSYDYYSNNADYIGGRLCFTDMKNNMRELEQGGEIND